MPCDHLSLVVHSLVSFPSCWVLLARVRTVECPIGAFRVCCLWTHSDFSSSLSLFLKWLKKIVFVAVWLCRCKLKTLRCGCVFVYGSVLFVVHEDQHTIDTVLVITFYVFSALLPGRLSWQTNNAIKTLVQLLGWCATSGFFMHTSCVNNSQ